MQTLAKTVEEKHLIPKSFLQSGFDLKITDTISCKHPTISEVLAIDEENLGLHSEEQYYSMVNLFLTDPYSYMVYLDDLGIDYEKSNSFEVFVLLSIVIMICFFRMRQRRKCQSSLDRRPAAFQSCSDRQ